jgi:Cu-Zn family superoxide dismutase
VHALRFPLALVVAAGLGISSAAAAEATAEMKDPGGATVGTVTLREVPHGVLLTARFSALPAGPHGFHVHAVGDCTPPFTSAGGHFNPGGAKHGLAADGGHHAGDMANLLVPASGAVEAEIHNAALRLDDALFDADGAAIVVHAGPDDHASDPAGDAGARIACGVIRR